MTYVVLVLVLLVYLLLYATKETSPCSHAEAICVVRTFTFDAPLPALSTPEADCIATFEIRVGRCRDCNEPELFCTIRTPLLEHARPCTRGLALGCADAELRGEAFSALVDYRSSLDAIRSS